MSPHSLRLAAAAAGFSLVLFSSLVTAAEDSAPGPKVLKWKDGRQAVFLLAFDDGAPSQLKNVVPELVKRKIVGTFYLVTGNPGLFAAHRAEWEAAVESPYIVAANHTFTHKGVQSVEELDRELTQNNEAIYAFHPGWPVPRLLAFGKPGGVPWTVTPEQLQAALTKHHLIDRPPFAGSGINYHSAAEDVAVVDRALASGEMGHLDFHGVGGDWLVTPVEWFTAVLDKLEANRDRLWITDAASWGKYVKERDGAEVKVVEAGPERQRLQLLCPTVSALYDEPLTLVTQVPTDWLRCRVVQGSRQTTLPIDHGAVQFSAVPNHEEIVLTAGEP